MGQKNKLSEAKIILLRNALDAGGVRWVHTRCRPKKGYTHSSSSQQSRGAVNRKRDVVHYQTMITFTTRSRQFYRDGSTPGVHSNQRLTASSSITPATVFPVTRFQRERFVASSTPSS